MFDNDTFQVILADRGQGKTDALIGEIHDLIVEGRRGEILVVLHDHQRMMHWLNYWRAVFPHVVPPTYTTLNNRLKVRGCFYSRIYIEDVDWLPDGIYDTRIHDLKMNLRDIGNNPARMIFTSSRLELNQRSHNTSIKPAEVLARTRRKLWKGTNPRLKSGN